MLLYIIVLKDVIIAYCKGQHFYVYKRETACTVKCWRREREFNNENVLGKKVFLSLYTSFYTSFNTCSVGEDR